MKVLIVEDEFIGRKMLQKIISPYADCDIAIEGDEAIQAFRLAWEENRPYDLILMDIMMPNVDGHSALKSIRERENEMGLEDTDQVKVIMTTALGDPKNVFDALYKGGANSYMVKPIDKQKLLDEIKSLGLLQGL